MDSICLGRNPQFAFAWDSAAYSAPPLPPTDYAQISWLGGGALSNAKFMYIGSYAHLSGTPRAYHAPVLVGYGRRRAGPARLSRQR